LSENPTREVPSLSRHSRRQEKGTKDFSGSLRTDQVMLFTGKLQIFAICKPETGPEGWALTQKVI
jgi:hypothetical protein